MFNGDRNSNTLMWIHKDATLPSTCITCGMYADTHATVKHSSTTETVVAQPSSQPSGIGCLLFFLGPLGMIISLVMKLAGSNNSGQEKYTTKKTTVKHKIKVTQCRLCQTDVKVVAQDSDSHAGYLAFVAHPEFQNGYQTLNPTDAPPNMPFSPET